jgi:signal transduction histidine kinase
LVKSIVDLHKGSISLESTEGEGSRFTLRLPASSLEVRGVQDDPRFATRSGALAEAG